MEIKRHRPKEIVTKLRQVEMLVGQGVARIDAIREIQITEQTFYRWRKQCVEWEPLNSRSSNVFRRRMND